VEWGQVLAVAVPSFGMAGALLKYVIRVESRLARIEARLKIEEKAS